MDIEFIIKFLPMYARAAVTTISIAAIGILLSFVTGFLLMLIWRFKIPVLSGVSKVYIELSRNTPLLVQLFFLYFGLPKLGILLSGNACAIVGLTFLGGSYMAEALRAGLESIEKIQRESAESLGLSPLQVFMYVELPQAFAVAVPSLSANIIFLVKETSVFSIIALEDLVFVAKDLIGLYYQTGETLILLVGFYLLILIPLVAVAVFAEKRVKAGMATV